MEEMIQELRLKIEVQEAIRRRALIEYERRCRRDDRIIFVGVVLSLIPVTILFVSMGCPSLFELASDCFSVLSSRS